MKKKFHIEVINSTWGWEIKLVSKNGNRIPKEGTFGLYDFKCQALKVAKSIANDAGWEIKIK